MGDVVVITKVPERGYVKRKLQVKMPAYLVEEIYIAFLCDTLDKIGEYDPFVAYYPSHKLNLIWDIIGERKYIVQRGKHIEERILNLFSDFYRAGRKDILLLGCDTPTFKKEIIEEAFKHMSEKDLVLGPSKDGGFYLMGGRGVSEELFADVEWKTPRILEKIIENAGKLGLKTEILQSLQDVDDPNDLKAVWESRDLDKESRTFKVMRRVFKKK